MRAYQAAMAARRLGPQRAPTVEEFRERVADAEALVRANRTDEAISRLTEIVESRDFAVQAETDEGRAAVLALGEAYAAAGIRQPARGYLRRVLTTKGAWESRGAYARRAVKKLHGSGVAKSVRDRTPSSTSAMATSPLAPVPSALRSRTSTVTLVPGSTVSGAPIETSSFADD